MPLSLLSLLCPLLAFLTWSSSVSAQIATGFVAHGAKVYITSRDKSACDDTAQELNKLGRGSCVAIPADLSRLDECDRLVGELKKREKRELRLHIWQTQLKQSRSGLHILVNNAGKSSSSPQCLHRCSRCRRCNMGCRDRRVSRSGLFKGSSPKLATRLYPHAKALAHAGSRCSQDEG